MHFLKDKYRIHLLGMEVQPKLFTVKKFVIVNNSPGIIIVAKSNENKKFLPLNSILANAYAVIIVTIIPSKVDTIPTMMVFNSILPNRLLPY